MSKQEQEARRALKARRKALDRMAGEIAAAGKRGWSIKVPSTRSKQAKWHHELAHHKHQLEGQYRALLNEMREIDLQLERKNACNGGSGALV